MTEFQIPGDLFARHQTITGLRALADFLEANPAVPVNEYGWTVTAHLGISRDKTDECQRAEVDHVAGLLGVQPFTTRYASHYKASRAFGRIVYQVVHIPARALAEHDARNSYVDNVQLDQAHEAA